MLQDKFNSVKTIAGITCVATGEDLLASVVVCKVPSMEVKEVQIFLLHEPLPYKPGYVTYREMPAMIEAYNKLQEEPDLILVSGTGILHPRKFGLASHLGLSLNKSTIGVVDKLTLGKIEKGNVIVKGEVLGFEVKTREYSKPIYVSPGHSIALGSVLRVIYNSIKFPHKMPEPIYLANKMARKKVRKT
jgi:deoxyribonuclease V